METDKKIGAISWMDLTVQDAEGVRDFYKNVIGWKSMDIGMGEYNDYCMMSPDEDEVRTGICHSRGSNANMPPAWIIYINVANLDERIAQVVRGGGEVVNGPRKMGEKARYCIIKDPAGAYCGLFDHGDSET